MQISITFRHMEATQAIRDHIDDKIGHLEQYLLHPTDRHVVLSFEKFRHKCEVILMEQNLKASADETTDDMYKSIDKCVDKIESQVKKHKKIAQSHHKSKFSMHDIAALAEKEYEKEITNKEEPN